MPIDRVFTVAGFGTVVTGTLWSGQIHSGDMLELMPSGRQARVRTIQVHNDKVPTAFAGQRVAVNLQGIEVGDIQRGYLLATPGSLAPSYRVDARLCLLHSSKRSLSNWNRVRFHLGTDETMGRVVLLDRDQLDPGEEALVQLVMERPVVAYKGDRFVIRYYSPVTTIGGGIIIDPRAAKQKRFREDVLEELSIKEEGSLYDRVLFELENRPEEIIPLVDLGKSTGSVESAVLSEIEQLKQDGRVEEIKPKEYISHRGLETMQDKITMWLKEYHQSYPLRNGYPREDLRSRFFSHLNPRMFNLTLKYFEDRQAIISIQNQLALPKHRAEPGPGESVVIDRLMDALETNLFSPPALSELRSQLNVEVDYFNEITSYLVDTGKMVKIGQEMVFSSQAIEEGKRRLQDYFQREKELPLGKARDLFDTSRKYMLPLMEYYDKIRYTRRLGDIRIKV